MKISAFLLFFVIFTASATEANSQSNKVNIDKANLTIENFIEQIEKQTNYLFVYSKGELNVNTRMSVETGNKSVKEFLDEAFKDSEFHYDFENDYIVLTRRALPAIAQQTSKKITGIVKDDKGEPIIGANVLEKGTSNGTITDVNGSFTLNVNENATLYISYIGYLPQDIPAKSQTSFNIIMVEDSKTLDEVVVTALGIKRSEKALGYAVQNVSGESLSNVKGTEVGTSLTGKIAGVNVQNSTEFNTAPKILVRGEEPLIVIDGVPYGNIGLREIAADDIESMSILKGSTASALYGYRGGSGAIMITTKRGTQEGLKVTINSNTMFHAGYLAIPEPQTSYSTGSGGKYDRKDYVWGDKMDIGRTAEQYDPITNEWREMPLESKGKNNFENFLEGSFVTNNNIGITYKGKNGSIRTSLTHVYNKGQYPNLRLNRLTYTVAGDMKIGKFSLDASASYNKRFYPQDYGAGYSSTGYIYTMLVWTGTDYDIRDYRNYWMNDKEDVEQNWWNPGWYDNPYFTAYARKRSQDNDRYNGQFNVSYELTPWLKATGRVGADFYSVRTETRTPLSTRGSAKGGYSLSNSRGFSVNAEAMLMGEYNFGDFAIDGFAGTSTYYYEDNGHSSSTSNGLIIPGFYSIAASVDKAGTSASTSMRQANSVFGKLGFSYKSLAFLDVTGRNDWVSTLVASERSYFYPSVGGSFIASELLPEWDWLSFWKLRGSWTMTKIPALNYEINQNYSINSNVWDNKVGATYPTTIRSATIKPETTKGWEIGTSINFLKNRIKLDVAYYQKLKYNIQRSAGLSDASGFSTTLINIDEEQLRKGLEVTLSADIFDTKDFKWSSTFNWARDRYYYHKIDETYSTDQPWVAPGKRWDWMGGVYDWQRDPDGNIVHHNGMPQVMEYQSGGYYEYPDWIWGFVNNFKYKDFTLSFTFDGRVGGYAYNRTVQSMWHSGTHPDSDNQWRYDEVVNGKKNYIGKGVKVVSGDVKYDSYGNITEDTRVFAENDVQVSYEDYIRNNYQCWSGNARIQNIRKLTFFKLRELTVGYTLPKHLCQKLSLDKIHVAFVGQNLLLWKKEFEFSDPDISSDGLNSPSTRMLGFNVKVEF